MDSDKITNTPQIKAFGSIFTESVIISRLQGLKKIYLSIYVP